MVSKAFRGLIIAVVTHCAVGLLFRACVAAMAIVLALAVNFYFGAVATHCVIGPLLGTFGVAIETA